MCSTAHSTAHSTASVKNNTLPFGARHAGDGERDALGRGLARAAVVRVQPHHERGQGAVDRSDKTRLPRSLPDHGGEQRRLLEGRARGGGRTSTSTSSTRGGQRGEVDLGDGGRPLPRPVDRSLLVQ